MKQTYLKQTKPICVHPQSQTPATSQLSIHPILQLQADSGNQATNQWLAAQQKTSGIHQPIQAKSGFQGLAQVLMDGSEAEELPATPTFGTTPTPSTATSQGKPMPEAVQEKMEAAFNTDFSDVRIHEGPEAEAIGAIAYTRGRDIHFAPGKYNPNDFSGQRLLGHELAHVLQQQMGRVDTPQTDSIPINTNPALEAEADRLGNRAMQGQVALSQSLQSTHSFPTLEVIQAKLIQNRVSFELLAGEKAGRSKVYKDIVRALDSYHSNLKNKNSADYIEEINLEKIVDTCDLWLNTNKGKTTLKGQQRRNAISQLHHDASQELATIYENKYQGTGNYEFAEQAVYYYRKSGRYQQATTLEIDSATTLATKHEAEFLKSYKYEDLEKAIQYYRKAGKDVEVQTTAQMAAYIYRSNFKTAGGKALDALYAARCFNLAGDQRKADIWYRVLRQKQWSNRNQNPIPVSTPITENMLKEADRYLGRLKEGDVARYNYVKILEKNREYDSGHLFRKEEHQVKDDETTIAEKFARDNLIAIAKAKSEQEVRQIRQNHANLDLPSSPSEAHDFVVDYKRDEGARAELELHLDSRGKQIVQGSSNVPFDTRSMYSIASGAKYAIFVMSRTGQIYATAHKVSRVHHTTPLAGGDVAAAGEMVIIDGKLKAITNKSGHYLPDENNLVQVLEELQDGLLARAVRLQDVALKFFNQSGQRWWDTRASGFLKDMKTGKFSKKLLDLDNAIWGNGRQDRHAPNL